MTIYRAEGASRGTLYQNWEWVAVWKELLTEAAAFDRTQSGQQLNREGVVEIHVFPYFPPTLIFYQ